MHNVLRDFNFTKINTPPWVFFTFFKLYKWYQIAQRTTHNLPKSNRWSYGKSWRRSFLLRNVLSVKNNTPIYSNHQIIKILENYFQNMNCFPLIKLILVLIHFKMLHNLIPRASMLLLSFLSNFTLTN